MAELRFTLLGTGSSGGVPRLGGVWGDCDPDNPKNRRRRCSMLIERITEAGVTRVLIDTSPDMRQQLLDAEVGTLDGVAFTHAHADHIHGIDDLRVIVFNTKERLSVWADGDTQNELFAKFGYTFVQPENSPYPPILNMHTIHEDQAFTISGEGGDISLLPLQVNHGSIDALGFKIEGLVYLPDVAQIPDKIWPELEGLEYWIVDALRRKPHPTHTHLAQTLDWIERVKPRYGVLTNMHIDMDYQTLVDETADNVIPAYDGMQISLTV
ncbi:MBL fold metallo-hydrolase [Roseovarius sp. EL26]|uniref:MBL fold metallo-hydrolase n=1 Tax=Roseovarius sp. EL26 TaxID=2126672 RepID=UPI000EA09A5D|nr:MBL fold metallo-hydrolase [Roseovarius sp. EL26]